MTEIDSILKVFVDLFNSGVLWKILLFIGVAFIGRSMYKIQHTQSNNVDFFDLIRDFNLPTHPLSRVGTFYVVGAASTTIIYLIACTRPTATIQDINIFTITYGGLCIITQGVNKFADRPPAPPAPEPPAVVAAPSTVINNQPGGAP